jgi:hypothetical protein
MRLKVDPRRGDQMVRGAAVLPVSWQTGLRIAVFAEGAAADDARAAGEGHVGYGTRVGGGVVERASPAAGVTCSKQAGARTGGGYWPLACGLATFQP